MLSPTSMKSYHSVQRFVLVPLALLLGLEPAFSQMPGNGANGMNAAMIKLFGKNTIFTAKSEFDVLDKAKAQTTSMPMIFSLLDGKVRADIDMNQVKSSLMPPNCLPTMKQMGMDRMATITRPDKKVTLIVYPLLKSYAEIPMSKEEAAAQQKDYKLTRTRLGKETIDGRSCEKSKITLTDDKGEKEEAIVWNAPDLKDFPVQIQMPQQDNTLVIKFNDVKLGAADASQFDAPGGMTKYPSAEKLMQDAMTKLMSTQGAPK
jgi:hypothetical protein